MLGEPALVCPNVFACSELRDAAIVRKGLPGWAESVVLYLERNSPDLIRTAVSIYDNESVYNCMRNLRCCTIFNRGQNVTVYIL